MSRNHRENVQDGEIRMPPEVKFKAAIFRKGIRPSELSKLSGKGPSDISKIISHGNRYTGEKTNSSSRALSPEMAAVFAPHLGVTAKWLFDGKNDIQDYLDNVAAKLEREAAELAARPPAPIRSFPRVVPAPAPTAPAPTAPAPTAPVAGPVAPIGANQPAAANEPPRTTEDPYEDRARTLFEYAIDLHDARDVIRALRSLKTARKKDRDTMVDQVDAPPVSGQDPMGGVNDDRPKI